MTEPVNLVAKQMIVVLVLALPPSPSPPSVSLLLPHKCFSVLQLQSIINWPSLHQLLPNFPFPLVLASVNGPSGMQAAIFTLQQLPLRALPPLPLPLSLLLVVVAMSV